MKKIFLFICLTIILSSCSKEKEIQRNEAKEPGYTSVEIINHHIIKSDTSFEISEHYDKTVEYYRAGKLVKSETYNESDERLSTTTYTYDQENLIKQERKSELSHETSVYLWDYEGDLLKSETYYFNQDLIQQSTYVYESRDTYVMTKRDASDQIIQTIIQTCESETPKIIYVKQFNAKNEEQLASRIYYNEQDQIIKQASYDHDALKTTEEMIYNSKNQLIQTNINLEGVNRSASYTYDVYDHVIEVVDSTRNLVIYNVEYVYNAYGDYISMKLYDHDQLKVYETRTYTY